MTYPAPAPAPAVAKPKAALITGIVLVVLSIVVFIGGIVWGAAKVASSVSDSPVFRAPGQVSANLDAGEHALWTPVSGEYLLAEDVTVTGPSGPVTLTDYYSGNTSVTVTKGSTSYSPEVTFSAPTSGSYTVVVSPSGPTTDVLVGPPTTIVGNTFIIIAIGIGIASLLGLIGVILFIVGLVRRGRAKRAGQPPMAPGGYGGPPPGYGGPPPGYGAPPGYGQPPTTGGVPGSTPPGYGQPPAAPPGYGGPPPGS